MASNPTHISPIKFILQRRPEKARKLIDPIVWRTYRDPRQELKLEIKVAEKECFADQILRYRKQYQQYSEMFRQCIATSTKLKLTPRMINLLQKTLTGFFVSVGQSTVDKIRSLADESDLTLNANYFVPRRMSDNSPRTIRPQ